MLKQGFYSFVTVELDSNQFNGRRGILWALKMIKLKAHEISYQYD